MDLGPRVLEVVAEDSIHPDVLAHLGRRYLLLGGDLAGKAAFAGAVHGHPDMGVAVLLIDDLGDGSDDAGVGVGEERDAGVLGADHPLHVVDGVVVEKPVVGWGSGDGQPWPWCLALLHGPERP